MRILRTIFGLLRAPWLPELCNLPAENIELIDRSLVL